MKRDNKFERPDFTLEDEKAWNEKLHIGILILLGIGIIVALIILFINRPDTMRTKVDNTDSNIVAKQGIREDNQKIVANGEDIDINYLIESLNQLTVTDTTELEVQPENIGDEATTEVTSIKRKVTLGDSSSIVKDIVVTNTVAGESLSLTRFQLADTLYKLLLSEDKLPVLGEYQVAYEDNQDIPSNYLSAVCYTTYLKVLDFGTKFDGYKYVTKEETSKAIKLVQNYLDNYIKPEETTEGITETTEDRSLLEQEAEAVLKSRAPIDRLYGQSVATFTNPKTLDQLEINQENIKKESILDINSSNLYDTEKKLNLDYINIDEALIDYTILSSSLDKVISGVTFVEPMEWDVEIAEHRILWRNDELLKNYDRNTLSFARGIVGIKDNKVVCKLMTYDENGDNAIYTTDKVEIDSFGFVLMRQYFENADPKSELTMDEQDYILMISKIN